MLVIAGITLSRKIKTNNLRSRSHSALTLRATSTRCFVSISEGSNHRSRTGCGDVRQHNASSVRSCEYRTTTWRVISGHDCRWVTAYLWMHNIMSDPWPTIWREGELTKISNGRSRAIDRTALQSKTYRMHPNSMDGMLSFRCQIKPSSRWSVMACS